ncbi:MAG: hypothetical protein BJ554DRAFT_8266 [Olpidium bornovanus]|uniref:Uncharacterized protein n=1 Tax=Olpidium bornovanus TaxID=278681 RepID=A0A8H7ZUB1_9FUNG|nr:MAG: hypothetical protein BJ554DRAFT_8266 [Olpidium bornovanus]
MARQDRARSAGSAADFRSNPASAGPAAQPPTPLVRGPAVHPSPAYAPRKPGLFAQAATTALGIAGISGFFGGGNISSADPAPHQQQQPETTQPQQPYLGEFELRSRRPVRLQNDWSSTTGT